MVVLVGSGHIYHMSQGGEVFSALKSKLKSFSICDLEAWIVQIICRSEAVLSLEKNKSFDLLVLKLSIPACARVKRAFAGWGLPVQGNICATAVCLTKTCSGETPQSLTETWVDMKKAHCQLMWALTGAACPEMAWQVADGHSGCIGRASGRSCRVRIWLDISPLVWWAMLPVSSLDPSSTLLPEMRGFQPQRTFFCLLGKHLQEGWIKGLE